MNQKSLQELQSKIWSMANIMRSAGLNTLQYIEQITDLLYLKILDDNEKNAEKRATRIGEDYFTRLGDNRYRFYTWVEEETDYVSFLDELYNHLREVANYNNHDNSGIRKIFKRSNLTLRTNSTLSRVVQTIAKIDLDEYGFDVKGAVYEFLLSKMQSEAGQLGQFFTPRHIVDAMIKIANPQVGERIYDPASGTGAFLTRAFKHVESQMIEQGITETDKWDFLRKEQFTGRDVSETTIKICTMNMMLHGDGHTKIMHGDTLGYGANQTDLLNKMDVVLANPPFGSATIPTDDLYNGFPVKTRNPENLFLQHIFLSLNEGGRACVVVPEGILFRTGADKRLRELLLEKAQVEAVISLPAGAFQPYTGVKTNIIVFKKGQPTEKVWFYSLEHDGFDLSANRRPINKNDLPDLIEKYQTKEESEKSWFATIEEIKENDCSFISSRYKNTDRNSDYELVELKELISLSSGKYLSKKNYIDEGEFPVYGANGIIGLYNESNTPKDTILIGRVGSCGEIHMTESEAWVTDNVLYVKDYNEEKINFKYLYFILKELNLKKFAYQSAVPSISQTTVLSQKIPLPPLHIQEQYVKRLEAQEEIIKQTEKTINLLKKTGIDESVFNRYDCSWIKLGDVADIKTGKLDVNAQEENGQYPFFTCSKEIFRINTSAFDGEYVLLAGNNASGDFNVKYYKGKFNAYQRTYVIQSLEPQKISNKLIYYILENQLKHMKEISQGSVTRYLKLGQIKDIPVPSLPFEIQEEIINRLESQQRTLESFEYIKEDFSQTLKDILSELFQ